jgi:hypothetical protein
MIPQNFVLLALCFNIFGTAIYIRQSLKNEVKPHLVTFFLWALAPLVAFAAQVSQGAGIVALVTLVTGVNPAVIFAVSIRRSDVHWSLSMFDVACGSLSLIGIILWWLSRDGVYAIALAIAADAVASAPTFRKSYSHPESESPILYTLSAISAIITLLSIQVWTFGRYGFAAYLLVIDLSLALIIALSGRVENRASKQID